MIDTTNRARLTVITQSAGSCRCGDCMCFVRNDGMIRYWGNEDWQRSEWKEFDGIKEVRRAYNSQLSVKDYDETMKQLKVTL